MSEKNKKTNLIEVVSPIGGRNFIKITPKINKGYISKIDNYDKSDKIRLDDLLDPSLKDLDKESSTAQLKETQNIKEENIKEKNREILETKDILDRYINNELKSIIYNQKENKKNKNKGLSQHQLKNQTFLFKPNSYNVDNYGEKTSDLTRELLLRKHKINEDIKIKSIYDKYKNNKPGNKDE